MKSLGLSMMLGVLPGKALNGVAGRNFVPNVELVLALGICAFVWGGAPKAFAAESFVAQKGCWVQFKTDSPIDGISVGQKVTLTDATDATKKASAKVGRKDVAKALVFAKVDSKEPTCPDFKAWQISMEASSGSAESGKTQGSAVKPKGPKNKKPVTPADKLKTDAGKTPPARTAYFDVLVPVGYQMSMIQISGSPALKGLEYGVLMRYEGHSGGMGPVFGLSFKSWKGTLTTTSPGEVDANGVAISTVKAALGMNAMTLGASGGLNFGIGAVPQKLRFYSLFDFDYGLSGNMKFTIPGQVVGPYKLKGLMRTGLNLGTTYTVVAGLKVGASLFGGTGRFQYDSTENKDKFNFMAFSGAFLFGYEF